MTIFNLITMLGEQVSGIEPIICGDQQDAVAYSCGVLTERTKAHAEMYANLSVHWSLEEGERSLGDATVPAGRKAGTWRLVFSGGHARLLWADAVSSGARTSILGDDRCLAESEGAKRVVKTDVKTRKQRV